MIDGEDPEKARRAALCSRIVGCQTAHNILHRPGASLSKADLPCASIVLSQLNADHCREAGSRDGPDMARENARRWLLPEPWNGKLGTAKLLFIGQNPSADFREAYPAIGDVPNLRALDFFESRFEKRGDLGPAIRGGVEVLWKEEFQSEGSPYSGANPFLKHVRGLAEALYGRRVEPGEDYALTEAVRCKSRNAIGVHLAVDVCARKFLSDTISCSGARVIVCLGALARRAFLIQLYPAECTEPDQKEKMKRDLQLRKELDQQIKNYPFGSVAIIRHGEDADRRVVFLAHSNARPKKDQSGPDLKKRDKLGLNQEMLKALTPLLEQTGGPALPWDFRKSTLKKVH